MRPYPKYKVKEKGQLAGNLLKKQYYCTHHVLETKNEQEAHST
jgi:hypothetical protein